FHRTTGPVLPDAPPSARVRRFWPSRNHDRRPSPPKPFDQRRLPPLALHGGGRPVQSRLASAASRARSPTRQRSVRCAAQSQESLSGLEHARTASTRPARPPLTRGPFASRTPGASPDSTALVKARSIARPSPRLLLTPPSDLPASAGRPTSCLHG